VQSPTDVFNDERTCGENLCARITNKTITKLQWNQTTMMVRFAVALPLSLVSSSLRPSSIHERSSPVKYLNEPGDSGSHYSTCFFR